MHKAFTILLLTLPVFALCQKQVGMEQYYYWQQKANGIIVPKVYYESPKKWYTEFRYNYEETETASLHFGKKINFKKLSALEITPVAGIIFGQLNGGSIGGIIEVNVKKFSFSSEPQYVFSFHEKYDNYIYSWSEISYEVFPFFYSGIALQQTKSFQQNNFFEPGLMAGFSIKNFDIPIYFFNPTSSARRNFVFGVNWQWQK